MESIGWWLFPGSGDASKKGTLLRWLRRSIGAGFIVAATSSALLAPLARGDDDAGSVFSVENESGRARTINVAGFPVLAPDNPFFRDLGVNGRRCVTCHQPANNMSVSATGIQAR